MILILINTHILYNKQCQQQQTAENDVFGETIFWEQSKPLDNL